jgi:hypothetical protein
VVIEGCLRARGRRESRGRDWTSSYIGMSEAAEKGREVCLARELHLSWAHHGRDHSRLHRRRNKSGSTGSAPLSHTSRSPLDREILPELVSYKNYVV